MCRYKGYKGYRVSQHSTTCTPPQSVINVCKNHRLSLSFGAIETLGGVVGLDILDLCDFSSVSVQGIAANVSSKADIVRGLWQPHLNLLDTLTNSDLPNQHFLYLLRNCAIAGPMFLTRCVPPSLTAKVIPEYRNKLLERELQQTIQHTSSPPQHRKSHAPAYATCQYGWIRPLPPRQPLPHQLLSLLCLRGPVDSRRLCLPSSSSSYV